MISSQPQQNIVNQQYIQGQNLELIKNSNGIIQMPQQTFHAQQTAGTPTSISGLSQQQQLQNQYNQSFGMVVHNYHRSSSGSYNGQQNLNKYENPLPQPPIMQYIKCDSNQSNGIELIQATNQGTPPSPPISPKYMKQKQKCMTYIINSNQPQIFEFVERRMSAPQKEDKEEVEKSSTRYSGDYRYKFSDSIQSTATTANPKTATVSVLSNNSPLQQIDHEVMKNAQIHLLNNPLQLEPSVGQIEGGQIHKDIQQHNEIITIDDYCDDTSENILNSKQNNQELGNQQEMLEAQKQIKVDYQQDQSPQKRIGPSDIQQQKEISIEINNNDSNNNKQSSDSQISKGKSSLQKQSGDKNQESTSKKTNNGKQFGLGTQQFKVSPKSQMKANNTGSANKKHQQRTDYQKVKGKSLVGVDDISSKINQKQFYIEDNHIQIPYSYREQHQKNVESHKLGVNKRSQLGVDTDYLKCQVENNDHRMQLVQPSDSSSQHPQIQVYHAHSKSSKDMKVNIPTNQFQTPISQKKEQYIQNIIASNEYQMEASTPHKQRGQESSSHKYGMSSSRQVTFPESPISVASKIDCSYGFGSDITYSEDLINENSARALGIKVGQIPLVASLGQFQGDNFSKGQKNTNQFLNIPLQQGLFFKINNPHQKQNEESQQKEKVSNHLHHQKDSLSCHKEQFTEEQIFSRKLEQKLFAETQEETATAKHQEEEDCEVNHNFINLYKTPAKQFSSHKNETTRVQSIDQGSQNTKLLANKSQQESSSVQNTKQNQNEINSQTQQNQKKQEQKQSQDEQVKIKINSQEKNTEDKKDDQKQINSQKNQINSEYNQQIKLSQLQDDNFNDYYNGDESPFIVEMKKQHQKIVEGFGVQPNLNFESKDELNLQNKESSKSSQSEAKTSQTSKNDSKKQRNNLESVQSINDLLFYMAGLPPASNFDILLPSNNLLTKQNLSLIFDEKSNIPSKVCSLKNIGEQQITFDENIQLLQAKQNQLKQENQQKQSNIPSSKSQTIKTPKQQQQQQQQQLQPNQKKSVQQKNTSNGTTSQDKLKKNLAIKRQETPPKAINPQPMQKASSQTGGLKIQDLYIGQYSSIKPQVQQNNSQKADVSLNTQQNQQKQKVIERKNSLIRTENMNNKNQGVINLQKLSQNSQQLQLIVQLTNNMNIENKTNNGVKESKSNASGISKSQKSSQQQLDNKSVKGAQNKSTVTQNSSTFYQNNSTITNAQRNSVNIQKSNLSTQSNFPNQANKPSEGGSILAESLLKHNDDQAQSLLFSQQDSLVKNTNQQKAQNYQSQASILAGKKFLSNKNSFEESEQDTSEFKNQFDNVQHLNQLMAQYSNENLTQPYIKLGQLQNKFKNAINVEETYQGLPRYSHQGNQDTDRSLKSDRQINVKKETKPSNLQTTLLKKQNSLHEKTNNQGEVVYNLQREGSRNSMNISSKNQDKLRDSIDKQSQQYKNNQKEVPFSDFKVSRKQIEQTPIQLKQAIHYRRESYSTQKIQNNHHETRERPSSIQKGTIHNSIDRSIHDLIEDGDRLINLDNEAKMKTLTSNSPIIHTKSKKKSAFPLSISNQNLFSYHGQTGSYASSNLMKNQYYSAGASKTNIPNANLVDGGGYSFQQPIIMKQSKSNQKLHSTVYNSIQNVPQPQKIATLKKEDLVNSPQKQNQFDKMK